MFDLFVRASVVISYSGLASDYDRDMFFRGKMKWSP